jgi:hypothetical protein
MKNGRNEILIVKEEIIRVRRLSKNYLTKSQNR